MKRNKRKGVDLETRVAKEFKGYGLDAERMLNSGIRLNPSYDVYVHDLALEVQVKKRTPNRIKLESGLLKLIDDNYIIVFSIGGRKWKRTSFYAVTQYNGPDDIKPTSQLEMRPALRKIRRCWVSIPNHPAPCRFVDEVIKTGNVPLDGSLLGDVVLIRSRGKKYWVQSLEKYLSSRGIHKDGLGGAGVREGLFR